MQHNDFDTAALKEVRYFLLDMDGTIYLDTTLFDGTRDFLDTLDKQGKHAIYITNNSSRNAKEYVEKLRRIGISSTTDDFCTSAHALVFNLNKVKPKARIFLIGTPALEEYLAENYFTIVREYVTAPEERPDFVVLGFDTGVTYDKLRIACDYLCDGVAYWATHPDMVCPISPGRSVPDAGAFMLLIEGATGRKPDFVAGKPNPCMIQMCMESMHIKQHEIAVVGDRLNTDIMSAKNAGILSVCVLTGEATLAEIEETPDNEKPDYVFDSIKDLYEVIK